MPVGLEVGILRIGPEADVAAVIADRRLLEMIQSVRNDGMGRRYVR